MCELYVWNVWWRGRAGWIRTRDNSMLATTGKFVPGNCFFSFFVFFKDFSYGRCRSSCGLRLEPRYTLNPLDLFSKDGGTCHLASTTSASHLAGGFYKLGWSCETLGLSHTTLVEYLWWTWPVRSVLYCLCASGWAFLRDHWGRCEALPLCAEKLMPWWLLSREETSSDWKPQKMVEVAAKIFGFSDMNIFIYIDIYVCIYIYLFLHYSILYCSYNYA